MTSPSRTRLLALWASAAVVLSACGGGSDGIPAPVQSPPPPASGTPPGGVDGGGSGGSDKVVPTATLLTVPWHALESLADLDALIEDVRSLNPAIRRFDCSCFDGVYVTGDVSQEYLDGIANGRSDGESRAETRLSSYQLDLGLSRID